MRIGAMLLFFMFVLLFVVVLFWGVLSFTSKILLLSQSKIPLSPIEDNVYIANSEACADSDNGVYFDNRGEVSFKQSIFFNLFKFNMNFADICNGNELTEYYCGGDGDLISGIIECEFGCNEGACVEN